MALCPLPSTDLFQYTASIAPGDEPELDLASLQHTLERRTGRTDIRLQEPAWSSVWRANVRLVDRIESYRHGMAAKGRYGAFLDVKYRPSVRSSLWKRE
jgi:hypothetical protein